MTFIYIEAIGAEDIPAVRKTAPDTYLVISVGNAVNSQKTKVFERSNRPEWNHCFSFILPSVFDTQIKCILFDYDDFQKDDSISQLIISSNDFEFGKIYEDYYKMTSTRGLTKGGRLHLKIQIAPRNHKPFTPFTGKVPKSAMRNPPENGDNSASSEYDTEYDDMHPKIEKDSTKNEETKQKQESRPVTMSPNSQTMMIQTSSDGSSFTVPLPSFSQAGMPNGYQAVVYIMPANQTPTPQTTWHIMNPPLSQTCQPQSFDQTLDLSQQTSSTIGAMSQTQPISSFASNDTTKPKKKSNTAKTKTKPKKRAKTSLKT